MPVEAFGIEKEFLKDLLEEAQEGRAQLPEFQRGWVWPVENIKSLLASISLGYPVGTLMMLRTGGQVVFKQRPIEGARPERPAERLILDGQQRITSLFQALLYGRALTAEDARHRLLTGWFYVDMAKVTDPDLEREEAFVFVPENRVVKSFGGELELDLSCEHHEYQLGMFPMRSIFDPYDWLERYVEHWDYDREASKRRTAFHKHFVDKFSKYQLPVIELGKDTERAAVCQVFEKVNTGGVTLTVFELVTATYAASEFDLRRDWSDRRECWSGAEYRILHGVQSTDFLQAVTLLSTYDARRRAGLDSSTDDERGPRVGCRRADMLRLPLHEYQQWAAVAVHGYKEAAKLLHSMHIFDTKFLPYGSQLIPLAAICAVLGHDATAHLGRERITKWLWCGILAELYGGTTESRFARDLPDVVDWVRGGPVPRTVEEAQFNPGRLMTLRTRQSAAYKGLYALLMQAGARDWLGSQKMSVASYFDDSIDIHHVFPKAWCDREGIAPSVYNSIINKTPLTARANRVLGGSAPSQYLRRLAKSAHVDLEAVVPNINSHGVDVDALRRDDFDAHLLSRRAYLLELVVKAMGKPVGLGGPEREESVDDDSSDDDLQD